MNPIDGSQNLSRFACLAKVQVAVLEGVREDRGALADGHVVADLQEVPVADVQRVNERVGADFRSLRGRMRCDVCMHPHVMLPHTFLALTNARTF